jgi:uncharacterized membrane protein
MTKLDTESAEGAVTEERIQHAFDEFETSFRRNHPIAWWMTLLGPLTVTLLAIVAVFVVAGAAYTGKLLAWTAAAFFLLGRFVILAGHDKGQEFLTSEQLFAMVTFMDMVVALLVAFHIGVLFRVPVLGPRVSALVADSRFILNAYPWMKRATFVGLLTFIAFPLAATGAIGGSILGRLLGLGRLPTFIATVCGCLIGNTGMYLIGDLISQWVDKDHWAVKYGGITVIILVVVFLEWRYRKMKQKFLKKEPAGDSPAESSKPENP